MNIKYDIKQKKVGHLNISEAENSILWIIEAIFLKLAED